MRCSGHAWVFQHWQQQGHQRCAYCVHVMSRCVYGGQHRTNSTTVESNSVHGRGAPEDEEDRAWGCQCCCCCHFHCCWRKRETWANA